MKPAKALLETYEPEGDRSSPNASAHSKMRSTISARWPRWVTPNSTEENWAAMKRLWTRIPPTKEFREGGGGAITVDEFNELNVRYGYAYDSAAVVCGRVRRHRIPMSADLFAFSRPGFTPAACLAG